MLKGTTNSSSTPLSGYKGDNSFSIPMNLDQSQSESSTGDSNPIGESSKYKEEKEEQQKDYCDRNDKKNNKKEIKNKKILNKKTKRNKISTKKCGNNSNTNIKQIKRGKIKNGKLNILFNIINEFKSSSLYNKFPQFHNIEKNVINELYPSPLILAKDVRDIFSKIFSSYLKSIDYNKYNQALTLCEYFEKVYKKYDGDSLTKQCKALLDEINRLKKEIHRLEIGKKSKNEIQQKNTNSKKCGNKNDISIQQYKDDILCNIKKLNVEQKKGIINIVSNNYVDKNIKNNIIEFDINKLPINQLKQLDKYINQCINFNNNIIFNEEKIINNLSDDENDTSSFLSSDDYSEDDELD